MPHIVPLIKPKIISRDPKPPGADCGYICQADDNMVYLVKDMSARPNLPANEWFCSCLAKKLGIPVPSFNALNDENGQIVFGSRWEGDQPPIDLAACISSVTDHAIFWRIYAFDLFINNEDRHSGNYLFRTRNSRMTVAAMDFSRAWTYRGWPLASQLQTTCSTIQHFSQFTSQGIIKSNNALLKASTSFLEQIKSLNKQDILAIVGSMPTGWSLGCPSDIIVDWWGLEGSSRADKIITQIEGNQWPNMNIQSSR